MGAGNPGQKECGGGDDVRKDSRMIAHERSGIKINASYRAGGSGWVTFRRHCGFS